MLRIGDTQLESRLVLGTGKYSSFQLMEEALEASETSMVTVAIRRVNLDAPKGEGLLDFVDREKYVLLPNTAGCTTEEDALFVARLAREALGTDLIKLEVIGDPDSLWPDQVATLSAAEVLLSEGFTVLPYCGPDPVVAKSLERMGCHAVMPLASPIGSGLGIQDPDTLAIVRRAVGQVPLIVDAGVGTASDAAKAMELGADGVLMNTAVAEAKDPVLMARSMGAAVQAGRWAFEAGRMAKRGWADPSSGVEGIPGS
ncbi:thiazole synthase [bacterium]|nr:thiazole synthase [bacterium]